MKKGVSFITPLARSLSGVEGAILEQPVHF